jgi:hypothetical protein
MNGRLRCYMFTATPTKAVVGRQVCKLLLSCCYHVPSAYLRFESEARQRLYKALLCIKVLCVVPCLRWVM